MGTYHAVRTVTHTYTYTHIHATLASILNEFSADCWNLQLVEKTVLNTFGTKSGERCKLFYGPVI